MAAKPYADYARAWNRRLDTQRRLRARAYRQAWKEAARLARWLSHRYDVHRVAVTGSLLDPDRFRNDSDLDLVVWGLPKGRYVDILTQIHSLTPFSVDLIPWEYATDPFRRLATGRLVFLHGTEI